MIFKIAGMIAAAILGILLVALFSLLFVPIRYKGDFSVSDAEAGEKKAVSVLLSASWFLWLFRVYASYEETFSVRIKFLFFTLKGAAKKEKQKKPKKQKMPEKKETTESIGTGAHQESVHEAEGEKTQEETEKKEKRSKKKQIFNILQTIRTFCDKLKRIKEKTEAIKELWNARHMAKARPLVLKELAYLLRHTKPKKLKGYLRFGFDDPAMTGYAMAGYGILYPIWHPKLSVEPDFEKQELDCRIQLKGKVRVCHLLKSGLLLFFSKDVRRVIKDIKEL